MDEAPEGMRVDAEEEVAAEDILATEAAAAEDILAGVVAAKVDNEVGIDQYKRSPTTPRRPRLCWQRTQACKNYGTTRAVIPKSRHYFKNG